MKLMNREIGKRKNAFEVFSEGSPEKLIFDYNKQSFDSRVNSDWHVIDDEGNKMDMPTFYFHFS